MRQTVIFFNVVGIGDTGTVYPWRALREKGSQETQKPPRVVWKAKKILWAGDAINDFIKELRLLRGET